MADDDLSMGYLMHWGARLLRRLADRRLKALGFSSAYLPIIGALGASAPLSQKALAAAASIEQPTMAATLTRMERDGVVQRAPDPKDGRSALFSLTAATRRKLPAMRRIIAEVNEEALGALPAGERAKFRGQLLAAIRGMERELMGEVVVRKALE
jgi:DNA-binding MarR family transcriptional regulator